MVLDEAPIVEADNLRRTYGVGKGERVALASISVTVTPGELVVVIGPSGCGKSTLLGVAGGLDRGYEGLMRCFGQDLARLSDTKLARLRNERIGFVFQAFHLLAHLTVLDNVLAPALFDPQGRDHTARARMLLERL